MPRKQGSYFGLRSPLSDKLSQQLFANNSFPIDTTFESMNET